MFRSFFNRRFYKSVSIILVVLLLSSIASRNLSLTRRHIQRCAVDVTEKSYYQLDVDGKPAAYFSDYTDSTFVGGSLSADSIHSRMSVSEGYWVNKLPILPSCFGRIAVIRRHYPSTIINLKDQKLRHVLMYALLKMDIKLVGLQSKRNETAIICAFIVCKIMAITRLPIIIQSWCNRWIHYKGLYMLCKI